MLGIFNYVNFKYLESFNYNATTSTHATLILGETLLVNGIYDASMVLLRVLCRF